jgi:hypothetical protein
MSTVITTIPNRPASKPVFDFAIAPGYCRAVLSVVSNDGQNLVLSGWAYQIDASGNPVLDTATAAPIGTIDSTRTVHLSGILAGTHSLYDGWCKYIPDSQTTITATTLPEGWTSGSGVPTTTPTYGSGYYDTAADQPYTYQQGCLNVNAQSFADALEAQIDTTAKLASFGI